MARAARIAALGLTFFALSATTAVAQVKRKVVLTGGSLYHAEDVAPNTIKTFTVTCPPGYVATSGSTSDADGATPLKSVPAGARSWTFTYGLPVTATRSAHVIVLVICTKPRPFLPGVKGKLKIKIKVGNVKSKTAEVGPGETEKKKLKCPDGSAPTGSGFQVTPPAQPKSVRAAAVLDNGHVARLTRDMPVRGGFRFGVHNPAAAPQRVRHSGRCLYRRASWRRRGQRKRHRAKTVVQRTTFARMATPGSNLFEVSAPGDEFPVGVGYSYASEADMIVYGHAVGRPRRVLVPLMNGEASSQAIRLFVLSAPGRLASLR